MTMMPPPLLQNRNTLIFSGLRTLVLALALATTMLACGGSDSPTAGSDDELDDQDPVETEGSWSALGEGTSGIVTSMALTGSALFVGGEFDFAGGAAVNNVARWDGSEWHAMATGVEFRVVAMAAGAPGSVYLAEGQRHSADYQPSRVLRWDGQAFSSLPTLPGDFTVTSLAHEAGRLYVGGTGHGVPDDDFTDRPDVLVFENGAWKAVGDMVEWRVRALAAGPGDDLYAAVGDLLDSGEVWRWDGGQWTRIGVTNQTPTAMVFDPDAGLHVGGEFTTVSGSIASGIARWDGTGWHTFGDGVTSGQGIDAIAVAPDGATFVAGGFTEIGGTEARKIAAWDGADWSALGGGVFGGVEALALDATGRLYVGGAFTAVDVFLDDRPEVEADNVAAWTP